MERCPGIPRRLKVLHRVVRHPELELPARHRLTDCVVLPFELVSNGRADEVSTISVEAVADHEIHASEIDETEVDRNFLVVGGLRSQLVNVCHIHPPFHPIGWYVDGKWMEDYKCAAMNLRLASSKCTSLLACFGGAEIAAANRHVAATAHGAPVSA